MHNQAETDQDKGGDKQGEKPFRVITLPGLHGLPDKDGGDAVPEECDGDGAEKPFDPAATRVEIFSRRLVKDVGAGGTVSERIGLAAELV